MVDEASAPICENRGGAPRTSARTVAGTLVAHDVDRVFTVAGESYLDVLDALRDVPGLDIVTCRHEGSAAFMAVADAKLTGRPGLCLVSRGPGAANALIGVHTAAQDAVPLLLLVGHVPRSGIGREAFQEIDGGAVFGSLAKAVWTVHEPRTTGEVMERAWRTAVSGTPGPVVVMLPEDVLAAPDPVGPRAAARAPMPAAPPSDAVRRTAALLAGARRPVLIAGGLLAHGDGRAALGEASVRLGLPVLTSNKHQDVFDNRHTHYAGHLNNAVDAARRAVLDEADLILAVGTRLDEVTTGRQRFPAAPVPGQPLVHVHPDPSRLAGTYATAIAAACDGAAFLRALTAAAPAGMPDRAAWLRRLSAQERESSRAPEASDQDDGVPFGVVAGALDRMTGGEALVTVDAGTFTRRLCRHLRPSGPGRLLAACSGAMGFGVPAGVAAALRRPGRRVISVVGDGGFLMNGSELATAVARSLPLLVVIADNASYGTIRLHQERRHPGRPVATGLANPDFTALAEAYGALALRVTDGADVEPALARALDHHDGPVVVHVRTSLELPAGPRLRTDSRTSGTTEPRKEVCRDVLA
ncbi:thiamine pyrophosphate-dependent enzyme [Streptomyces griseoincarnatus]